MSTKAATEHKQYYFKPCQYADGTPFIGTEPINGELSTLKDKYLAFSLRDDITLSEVEELAVCLNKNIKMIGETYSRESLFRKGRLISTFTFPVLLNNNIFFLIILYFVISNL